MEEFEKKFLNPINIDDIKNVVIDDYEIDLSNPFNIMPAKYESFINEKNNIFKKYEN